jgi:anti-sigma regulatory factor (Ser/Thr protein kinase)
MWTNKVKGVVTVIVGSCYAQVATITTRLLHVLRSNGCSEDRAQMLAVGTAELMNNIIEHSLFDVPGSDIIVELAACDGRLELRVTDHGKPVPADLLSRINPPEVDPSHPELLPESGRGLYIASQLFSTLDWRNIGNCNVLHATAHY